MSPVAFSNFRSTQTGLDLNGPTIDITTNPTNVVGQPDAFQTPFGPATGALPIRNTTDDGLITDDTFRTDPNKADLVLALPFNTTGGDVSADISGTGGNKVATDTGATTSTDQSIFYGTSYKFTGGNDYISFGDVNDWYFNGDFTVEGWVWFDSNPTSTNEVIISQWYNDSVNSSFKLTHEISGILRFHYQNTGATDQLDSSVLVKDRWYHYAFTLNGTTARLFLDGRQQEAKTVSGSSINSGAKLILGGQDNGSGKGNFMLQNTTYMQDVRIYKGLAKYTSDFTPAFPTSDLVSTSLVGISTFIGIGTATLGTPNGPGESPISGSFIYQWYDEDGKLSDGDNVTGTATTTLTLSNLSSPTDNGRNFYLEIGYASGTYNSAGRGVGNALNGPLNTSSASLTVLPEVSITSQPVGVTIGQGEITTFTSGATTTDASYGALTYYWTKDVGDGEGPQVIEDEGRAGALTGNYASGATTPTLEIKKTTVGVSTIQFHAYQDAAGYRVNSKSVGVGFTGVLPRSMVKFEAFTASTNLQKSIERNIGQDGAFTLDSDTFGSDYGIIQFFSPEENYNLRMTISASKGADNGIYSGGGGGKSVIDFRILKNIEYTLIGISNNSSIFLYRGAQLMAVVGQGGDAGTTANGGGGGGINMAGGNGSGKDGGSGGLRVAPGNFNLTGQWGSVFSTNPNFTRYDGDIIATTPNGGRTISCSRGTYWINQGIGACENNSTSEIKYRYIDGTEASGSAEITRGFKPGYTVTETSGLSISDGGNGGNGATGGEGGVAGSGGGGGSGYSDDTFDLKSSELGGNTSTSSSVIFEIAV